MNIFSGSAFGLGAEVAPPPWFEDVAGRALRESTADDIQRAVTGWSVAYAALSNVAAEHPLIDEQALGYWVEALGQVVRRGDAVAFVSELEKLGQDLALSRVRVNSVIRGAQATWLSLYQLAERLPGRPHDTAIQLAVYESLDVLLNAYYEAYALSGRSALDTVRYEAVSPAPAISPAPPGLPGGTTTTDLDEFLPRALGRAVTAVGAESGSLLLRSDLVGGEFDEWVLTTTVGLPLPHAVRFPRNIEGSNDLTACAEAPVVISAAREWNYLTAAEREFVERCGIRSAVGVALRSSDGETLGILFTNSGRERFFDHAAFGEVVHMGRTIADSLTLSGRQRVFHTPLASLGGELRSGGISGVEEKLMSALLRDRDLEDVCRALEESSGCRVRVVDESHGVIYSSAHGEESGGTHAERPILRSDGFAWGRVIVRDGTRDSGAPANLAEVANAAAAGIERWERARAARKQSVLPLEQCVADVLAGSRTLDELARHRDIGRVGEPPYRLAGIVGDARGEWDVTLSDATLRLGVPAARPLAVRGRGAMFWLGASESLDHSFLQELRGLLGRLRRQGVLARIVMSPPFDSIRRIVSMEHALRQGADLALQASVTEVLEGDELGVDELMLLGEPEFRERFVNRVAGRLMDYDRAHDTDLAKSLATFLDHGCSIKQAAEQLYVHPNTLRYRLGRIESLVPGILDNGEVRLRMQLALKLCGVTPTVGATTV